MKTFDVDTLLKHIISNIDRKIAGSIVDTIVLDVYAIHTCNGEEEEYFCTNGGFWTQFFIDSYFDCTHMNLQEVDADKIDITFKARAVDLLGSIPLTYLEYYYHDGCDMCRYLMAVPTSQLMKIF